MKSIKSLRKKPIYRILESLLGLVSISFLSLLFLLAIFSPVILAVFLISYSFFMVLKTGLHGIYTIYTYKHLRRMEIIDWQKLLNLMESDKDQAFDFLQQLKNQYSDKIDWSQKFSKYIFQYNKVLGTKYENPKSVVHVPIFAVYNESPEIIERSLEKIFSNGYNLENIIVVISQEDRAGKESHKLLEQHLKNLKWVNLNYLPEVDLETIYNPDHTGENVNLNPKKYENIKISKSSLNVLLTYHPDGLEGEIRGKASNEDWAGRGASLYIKATNQDPEKVVLTSLDSDSRVGKNFFSMLSFNFCLNQDRHKSGFQPLPVYTNNFFSSNLFPRLVATNTTIWYMIQSTLLDELHFFANYSVPLSVLRKIDFWNREVIAEDSLLFAKCFVKFEGDFLVHPFYGTFEGDAVEGEDYLEALVNQYKQLQRWAWGGIEGFPYKFYNFFIDPVGKKIPLKKRLKMIRIEFLNHFFWATLPLVFSVVAFLPELIAPQSFKESTIQINLWIFGQYFTWLSFIFLIIAGYISFKYIAKKATKNFKAQWYHWFLVSMQWLVSPMIFVFMGPPALDVQIRGILGKYLGYWVTPKK